MGGRCCIWILLYAPLATDLGASAEAMAGGALLDRKSASLCLGPSLLTSGLALRRWRRGALMDG